jgi:C-terminal peptidase prc
LVKKLGVLAVPRTIIDGRRTAFVSHGQLHVVVRHLRRVAGDVAPCATDRQLLERFSVGRDEAAFAALVERHGPLVWGVCRRVLRQEQDAEDAFQATFLVLARKAGTVRWRDSVHNWLYEVASRLAAEARVKAARRRLHEGRAAALARTETLPDDIARELGAVLDEELRRLPARLRAPLLLCYLEGRTSDQAARHLGWSLRTLQRRLAQGRDLLRVRLTRRGLTLSAALAAPALARGADVPALLAVSTVKTAVAFTAGVGAVPAGAAALARAMLRGMVMTRVRFAALALLVLGTIAGAGVLIHQPFGNSAAAEPPAPARQATAADKDKGATKETPRKPTPFAQRLWAIMDLVQQKHPEPPPRGDMILGAAQALYKATKQSPPDDLKDRVARLHSSEQLGAFLQDAWPKPADAPRTEVLQAAVLDGLLSTLPGSGVFLPPDQAKAVEANSANRYVGIGIQVRVHPEEKVPQIVTPVGKGPARKGGIEPGDLILQVDGKSTRDVPLAKVVEWLRGDEGTSFTMVVRAPGADKSRTLKFTRTVVPFDSVLGYRRAPEDGWEFRIDPQGPIAYVRLEQLRSSTPHELRQVERRLRAEGARAVVLDLRNGGGGDLHNGTLVAAALLDGQPMWSLRGADKQVQVCRAGRECQFRGWPMAVLINDQVDATEGAVAAALQDNGRAVLVGEPTRNGGFVNTLVLLPDGEGALSIRTGRLERTAKDRSWPVRPDQVVPLTKEQREAVGKWLTAKTRLEKPGSAADKAPADPQLDKAVELLRAALKNKDEGR